MTTRHELLVLLRKQPGATVSELARELGLSDMGVRRHLTALADAGLVENGVTATKGPGRPAAGWRLSAAGLELLPRRYDTVALHVLEDLYEEQGADAVDAVLRRRTDKQVADYERRLAGTDGLPSRVAALAAIRDQAGYLADYDTDNDGNLLLVESNCAVHRVAERFPTMCAMELSLLRRVMGPGVDVTRVAHAMSGDAVCRYRIRPVDGDGSPPATS